MKEVIRAFDLTLCDKASKEGLKSLNIFCRETFILKEENEAFKIEAAKNMEEQNMKVVHLSELVNE